MLPGSKFTIFTLTYSNNSVNKGIINSVYAVERGRGLVGHTRPLGSDRVISTENGRELAQQMATCM